MPWARLDDGFHDHPKVEGLSLAAVGLWSLNFTWAHKHRKTAPIPGFIPIGRVQKQTGKQHDALIAELVAAPPGYKFGLWEPVEGGWLIHDFEQYLPKARDPQEASEAGKKGAAKRWQDEGKADG